MKKKFTSHNRKRRFCDGGIESVADKNNIRLFVGHNIDNMTGQIAIVGQSQGKICYTAKTAIYKEGFADKNPEKQVSERVLLNLRFSMIKAYHFASV